MKHPPPCIGVTGPDKGGTAAWWFTAWAVRRAGGRPLRIRPRQPCQIERLDGLIIGGGADVSPKLYGQEAMPRLEQFKDRDRNGWRRLIGLIVYPLLFLVRRMLTTKTSGRSEDRDALEKKLIQDACEHGRPIFGICRGMQLINVVLGGSLHQSIRSFYEEEPQIRSVLPRKRIEIQPGSLLARVLSTGTTRVNTLHSQAIDTLGADLVVCAREPTGVIQAIEHRDRDFILGVQWHPEYLPQRREQLALFRALITAAARS
ncbi:MAG: gamma-glutamyl-gamma-aminobutyrate hydrolase family protein [Wenzhouxiangella sp.]|jgi:putative glutamine amidotransferase|nr:gamma-glutamyl-gamma-aminobutyrate hydrolase family protein [Wenzhouxiangella sp.]